MQTSHKLTRIFVTLVALVMMAMAVMAGDDPQNVTVSDQKAGTLLVFPYYTNVGQSDTRITITNAGGATIGNARVHIILMDKSCQQLDYYACISPNGSLVDKASTFDPTNSGYIIAHLVNADGFQGTQDILIGNAFVNDGDFVGTYGAEAFGLGPDITTIVGVSGIGKPNDFVRYGLNAPCEFAVEIQSPKDAVQKIITVGLQGDVNLMTVTGAGQVGTGFAYNAQERGGSFQKFLSGSCYAEALITDTNPRIPTTLAGVIPSGNSGHLRFSVGAAVGLILTSNKSKSNWSGIRTLHKTKTTPVTLSFPLFMPTC